MQRLTGRTGAKPVNQAILVRSRPVNRSQSLSTFQGVRERLRGRFQPFERGMLFSVFVAEDRASRAHRRKPF